MNDGEIEKALDEMRSMFGELPSPEHEPRRFAWYVKLWKYYKIAE
jgi:hypothetical protein